MFRYHQKFLQKHREKVKSRKGSDSSVYTSTRHKVTIKRHPLMKHDVLTEKTLKPLGCRSLHFRSICREYVRSSLVKIPNIDAAVNEPLLED